jgi:hypothetical protein
MRDTVNYDNTDSSIGRLMGVDRSTARYQRKLRGIKPHTTNGYMRGAPYKP